MPWYALKCLKMPWNVLKWYLKWHNEFIISFHKVSLHGLTINDCSFSLTADGASTEKHHRKLHEHSHIKCNALKCLEMPWNAFWNDITNSSFDFTWLNIFITWPVPQGRSSHSCSLIALVIKTILARFFRRSERDWHFGRERIDRSSQDAVSIQRSL